jgi:hypothetical protein
MSRQRLDVKQAAEALNISSEGVRKRIRRGTLDSEKAQNGKVYVWLDVSDADRTHGPTGSDNATHANEDADRTGYGQGSDTQSDTQSDTKSDALHSSLQDQVSYLRKELDQEREANRENRRLLAAALERIPEIEAPRAAQPQAHSEPREAPETAKEGEKRVDDVVPPEASVGAAQRRSWLYRFFGFE